MHPTVTRHLYALGSDHPGIIVLIIVYRIQDSEDHIEEIVCSSFAIKLVLNEGDLWTVPHC